VPPNPNVVLVHGAWADGSSWSRVIPLLQEKDYPVTAIQLPLTSLADDVATTRRFLESRERYTVLAGHCYGGAVISLAAVGASHVVSLVFAAAFAPDEGETLNDLNKPAGPGQAYLRPDDRGFLWIDPEGFHEAVAADVDRTTARVMAAVQKPIAARIFGEKAGRPAWLSTPSSYLISENDRIIPADTQRSMAERMRASLTVLPASHASPVSRAQDVAQAIMDAARMRAGAH